MISSMKIYQIKTPYNKKEILKNLGVQSGGISIMSKKMEIFSFYLKDLATPAINILKQDALSIGADLAVPSGVITCSKSHYDCILMGTQKHIEILSRKELAQPFRLKEVAKELKKSLQSKEYPIEIMGIINANEDSFFEGSRFVANGAIEEIEKMIESGADIIDVGAVSSRPNADEVNEKEELRRVTSICDLIYSKELYKKVLFSIDSYTPRVIEYALQRGFGLINDITGARDKKVIELAIKYDVKLCIMHMQNTPQTMQNSPRYDDVMVEVSEFFEDRIECCEDLGLKRESIILDVGVGFGKTLEHNITLIKNMRHFKKFGCKILIGASRKSMIDHIIPTSIEDRLAGSIAIHLRGVESGASIVRCHDVAEHKQALSVWEAMR